MPKKKVDVNRLRGKRTPKKGWVYLLSSEEKIDFGDGFVANVYKYGATRKSIEERCKRINYCQKYARYRPIAGFKSADIFRDERKVALWLLPAGFAMVSEYIGSPDLPNDKTAATKFIRICEKHSLAAKKKKQPIIWVAEGII